MLWPPLPYEEWKDTYATLHMWTQIVGKVALAAAPPINHGWGIAFHVTPRGLSTRTLAYGGRSFSIEFDFIEHLLRILTSDGDARSVALAPRSVADFYRELMAVLGEMSLPSHIWSMRTYRQSTSACASRTQNRSWWHWNSSDVPLMQPSLSAIQSATTSNLLDVLVPDRSLSPSSRRCLNGALPTQLPPI